MPSQDDEILDFLGRPVPLVFRNQQTLGATGAPLAGTAGPATTTTGMAGPKKPGMADDGGKAKSGLDLLQFGEGALKGASLLKKILSDAGYSQGAQDRVLALKGLFEEGGGGLDPSKFSLTGTPPADTSGLSLTTPTNFANAVPADAPIVGGTGFAESTAPALDPSKFTLTGQGPTDIQSLIKESGAKLFESEGGQSLQAQLGEFAPYLSALTAALQIGQMAASDQLSDEQKAVGAGTTALGAAGSIAAASAASAAGASAGAAGGVAGVGTMILAMIAQHVMEAMQDVPHDVREALDYFHSRINIGDEGEAIDQSFTPEALSKNLILRTSGQYGGGFPGQQSAFITYLDTPKGRKALGTGKNSITLDALLADPGHAGISWQKGLSSQYLDPTNKGLTGQLRNRLALLARARSGDPEAIMAVQMAKARYEAYVKNRNESEAAYRNYTQHVLPQSMAADYFGGGGDSGGGSE